MQPMKHQKNSRTLVPNVFFGLVLMAILVVPGCQTAPEYVQVKNAGPAQGSFYHVSYVVKPGTDFRQSIDSILFVIDESMSLWDPNSTLSRLNRGDTVKLDKHLRAVLKKAIEVSVKTNGAFDVSVAALADYWGFGPNQRGEVDSAIVDSLRRLVNYNLLTEVNATGALPPHMKVDLNAIAQGYSVDVVCAFLEAKGVDRYLVEIGGEIRGKGTNIDDRIWRVGVDKPKEGLVEEGQFQVILDLNGKGLATSGNYRKFWVDEQTGMKYVHTINPKTGYPAKSNLLSATVVANDAMTADAWATACMVVGAEKGREFIRDNGLDAYFVYSDDEGNWLIWQTPGFEEMAH